MDCGAYKSNDMIVVRIKGSEYSMSPADLFELSVHMDAIMKGANESMSEDYKSIPPYERVAKKGEGKINLDGLFKFQASNFKRRF